VFPVPAYVHLGAAFLAVFYIPFFIAGCFAGFTESGHVFPVAMYIDGYSAFFAMLFMPLRCAVLSAGFA